jgi:hypothetical protein
MPVERGDAESSSANPSREDVGRQEISRSATGHASQRNTTLSREELTHLLGREGFSDLFAQLFSEEHMGHGLIIRAGGNLAGLRPFLAHSPREWWGYIYDEAMKGRFSNDGVAPLLRAAADDYPGHDKLQFWRTTAEQPRSVVDAAIDAAIVVTFDDHFPRDQLQRLANVLFEFANERHHLGMVVGLAVGDRSSSPIFPNRSDVEQDAARGTNRSNRTPGGQDRSRELTRRLGATKDGPVRAVLGVFSRWNISDELGCVILGSTDPKFLSELASGRERLDTRDRKDRARLLLDIYEGVYTLLRDPVAEREWITLPRGDFEQHSLLDLMTEGSQRNLMRALAFVEYVNGR